MNETQEVSFKSVSHYFDDEEIGLKNWTIREYDDNDIRFKMLNEWMHKKDYGAIKIVRAELPNNYFRRQVKHVTVWGKYMCITWRS